MAKKTLGVNPWLRIWFKPRHTIAEVVNSNPRFRFAILSFLYGLPMLFHMAQNLNLGASYPTAGIVVVALVLATFAGMLGIVIASWLIHWTGKWIGGTSNFINVRAAISWSNVPNIFPIIMWALLILNFRERLFLEQFDEMHFTTGLGAIVTVALIVQAIAAIWSFVILVKSIGQVQGFSAWKGVLNVLIPFFMVGIAIWILTWIFWVGNGMPAA